MTPEEKKVSRIIAPAKNLPVDIFAAWKRWPMIDPFRNLHDPKRS